MFRPQLAKILCTKLFLKKKMNSSNFKMACFEVNPFELIDVL